MSVLFNNLKLFFAGKLIPQELNGSKMAIVVRTDINMGKGKMAAQCAHAAVECYRQALANNRYKSLIRIWVLSGQPKIVLKVSSCKELEELAKSAKSNGVITAIIRDAGRTQLAPGTVSVLGIGPASKIHIEKLTSNLKLL